MLLKFVSAFSNNVNAGNPTAVYLVDDFSSDKTMQGLATKKNESLRNRVYYYDQDFRTKEKNFRYYEHITYIFVITSL